MFQPARINGSKYCGPTSLSAVTGIGTKELCQIIRHINPKRKMVKGLNNTDLEKTLRYCGINWDRRCYEKITLGNWNKINKQPDAVYIIQVSNHYLVIKNGYVICTQFGGRIESLCLSKYLKCQVHSTWQILTDPSTCIDIPNVTKNKRYRCKLIKFCELHDIEFDDHDHKQTKGEVSIWMFLPDNIIKDYFDGKDPWDDDHYACDYEEAWDKIQEVMKSMQEVDNSKEAV
jgi:hypothetical protein